AASVPVMTVPSYQMGDVVDISRFSDVIPKDAKVSLVELSMHETEGASYQTIVAKVKIENTGTKNLPIPPFMSEIVTSDGFQYAGIAQSNAPAQVLPGLASIVTYAYTVPASEKGENVVLKLQQPVAAGAGVGAGAILRS